MATDSYKTIMAGEIYPKRSSLHDASLTQRAEEDLSQWERITRKDAIAKIKKRLSTFRESIY